MNSTVRIVAIVALCAVVALATFAAGYGAGYVVHAGDGPEQYYRAHYDVCHFVYERPADVCLAFVDELREMGAYEAPSPGWEW